MIQYNMGTYFIYGAANKNSEKTMIYEWYWVDYDDRNEFIYDPWYQTTLWQCMANRN